MFVYVAVSQEGGEPLISFHKDDNWWEQDIRNDLNIESLEYPEICYEEGAAKDPLALIVETRRDETGLSWRFEWEVYRYSLENFLDIQTKPEKPKEKNPSLISIF